MRDYLHADDPAAADEGRELIVPRVEDVQPLRWAWDRRVLLRYLNLLVGVEGIGKGVLLAWLVAQWTRGELPGHLHGAPANVLFVGDEDGVHDVWTPRLHVAGADLDRIRFYPPGADGLDIHRDADRLRQQLDAGAFRVLVLDQLLDNLAADVNDWRAKDVRRALAPLRTIAHETDVAIVAALHPVKGRVSTFRDLVSGSHAFSALTRSGLVLAADPDDDDRRVLVRGKNNHGRPVAAFEFAIESRAFDNGTVRDSYPAVAHPSESERTLDELLTRDAGAVDASGVANARRLLQELLDDGEWHEHRDVLDALAAHDMDVKMIERAAAKLRVEKGRTSTFPGRSRWRLRRHSHPSPGGVESVVSVVSGGSANGRNRPPHHTHDTHDTHDSPERGLERVESGEPAPETLEQLLDRDPEATRAALPGSHWDNNPEDPTNNRSRHP